jgi:hypothetical protein
LQYSRPLGGSNAPARLASFGGSGDSVRVARQPAVAIPAPKHDTTSLQGRGYDFSRVPVRNHPPVRIQAKLTVGHSDDPLEHEADRIAEQVMRMPEPGRPAEHERNPSRDAIAPAPPIQAKSTNGNGNSGFEAPPIVHDVLNSPGQPLDAHVRLHSDKRATESARIIGAEAYAADSHIALRGDRFTPGTAAGRRVLAHELAHVIQGHNGMLRRQTPIVPPRESEANEGSSWLPDLYNFQPGFIPGSSHGGIWMPPIMILPNLGIGMINNRTNATFIGMAGHGKGGPKTMARIPPGKWGGGNPLKGLKGEDGLNDIDFVFATPTTPINGQKSGVFKIGGHEASIVQQKNGFHIENFDSYGPSTKSFDKGK